MSTSNLGSNRTSQEAENLRIKTLERDLFVANGRAQGFAEEKRQIKRDFETETQKLKQDFATETQKLKQDFATETQKLATEIEKLQDENKECRLVASYDLQNAANESQAMKLEIPTLRAQSSATGDEHQKDDIAGNVPSGASDPPLSNEGLQAENTRLKAEVNKLTAAAKIDDHNIEVLMGMVEGLEQRILRNQDRLKALRENADSLGRDVASYRDIFQKMCRMSDLATEAKAARYLDAQRSAELARLVQQDFEGNLERKMDAIRLFKNVGLQGISDVRARSEGKWTEVRSHIDRSYKDSVDMAREILQQQPTTVLPKLEPRSNVAPATKAPVNKEAKAEKVETPKSSSKAKIALLEQKEHQMSDRISALELEAGEAGQQYKDLEGRHERLERQYRELQGIHSNVAKENADLNKKIERTLEAFIPTAEKVLHQGTKLNKPTRDVLNSLIKIVRDGLRNG